MVLKGAEGGRVNGVGQGFIEGKGLRIKGDQIKWRIFIRLGKEN